MTKRIKAFEFAFSGIIAGFKKETHLKLHAISSIFVVAAGIYFGITSMEWVVILTCCCMVIAAELMNSAIEKVCDLITPNYHPKIKYIKDMSAGAVLVLCIASVIVAGIVFVKYTYQ